jgi:hypothetical protein
MNKCLLTLCLLSSALFAHAQAGMKPRLGIYIGLANPKATEVFGQFYKSKGIQPRNYFTNECNHDAKTNWG